MRITIITACYNAASTIRTALESVRRQKVDGFELEHIVVDGASTDGTVEQIRAFADRQVKIVGQGQGRNSSFRWISEPDKGLYDALNKGIGMATGDVIGICSADDVFAADDVLLGIAADLTGMDAVYADVRFVSGGDTLEGLRAAPTVRYCTGRFFRKWMFRFATFPAHPSTFIRKDCFDRYGLYSIDYPICADFELMLRFFYKNGIRARYLPVCTHVMRKGGVSTGGLKSNIQINREDMRALRANGVWSCMTLVYLKYLAKVWGLVFRRRYASSSSCFLL